MEEKFDTRELLDAYDTVSKKYLYEAVSKQLARTRPQEFIDVVNELTRNKDVADALMEASNNRLIPVKELLKAGGEKIGAIKKYREITGCSLKESKDAVEDMMENILGHR